MSSSAWLSFLVMPWRKSNKQTDAKQNKVRTKRTLPEVPESNVTSPPVMIQSRSYVSQPDDTLNQTFPTPEGLRSRDLGKMRMKLGLPPKDECKVSRHFHGKMYAEIEKRNRETSVCTDSWVSPKPSSHYGSNLFSPNSEEMFNYYNQEYNDDYSNYVETKSPFRTKRHSSVEEELPTNEFNKLDCSSVSNNRNQETLTATAAIVALSSNTKRAKMNSPERNEWSPSMSKQHQFDISLQSMDSPTYRYAWKKLGNDDCDDSGIENSFSSRKLLYRYKNEESNANSCYNFEHITENKCNDISSPSGTSHSSNMLSISTLTSQTYDNNSGSYANRTASRHSEYQLDGSKEKVKGKYVEPDDLLLRRKCQNQRKGKERTVAGLVAKLQGESTLHRTKMYRSCIGDIVGTRNLIYGYEDYRRNEVLSKIGVVFYSKDVDKLSIVQKYSLKFLSDIVENALPSGGDDIDSCENNSHGWSAHFDGKPKRKIAPWKANEWLLYLCNSTLEHENSSKEGSIKETFSSLLQLLNNLSRCVEQILMPNRSCCDDDILRSTEEIYLKMMNLKTRDMSVILNAFSNVDNTGPDDCSSTDSPFIPADYDHTVWIGTQSLRGNTDNRPYLSPDPVYLMDGSDCILDEEDSPWSERSDLTSDPFRVIQKHISPGSGAIESAGNSDLTEEELQYDRSSLFFSVNDSACTSGGLYSIREASVEGSDLDLSNISVKTGASEKITPVVEGVMNLTVTDTELPTDEKLQLDINVNSRALETPDIQKNSSSFKSPSTSVIKNRNFQSEFSLEAKSVCALEREAVPRDKTENNDDQREDLRRTSTGSFERRIESTDREEFENRFDHSDIESSAFSGIALRQETINEKSRDICTNKKFSKPSILKVEREFTLSAE